MMQDTTVIRVFRHCVAAIRDGKLIHRESRQDKEFHFQNWVRARLDETGIHHDVGGRNTYPDFRIVRFEWRRDDRRIACRTPPSRRD